MSQESGGGGLHIFDIVALVLGLIALVVILVHQIGFFADIKDFFTNDFDSGRARGIINLILAILSIFFLTIIAYTSVRLLEIRKREHEHLHHEMEEYRHHQEEKAKDKKIGASISHNEKWLAVLEHLESGNESEWKLAIIEADTILFTLLESLGFVGDDVGDKLKTATQENFPDLTLAWQVHTMRNRIAHEAGLQLSLHEARRIIADYEQIFRRFGYV